MADAVLFNRDLRAKVSDQGVPQDNVQVHPAVHFGFHSHASFCASATEELEPIPDRPIYVGLDFGLTPAALFGQITENGQWRWLDELVTEDMGAAFPPKPEELCRNAGTPMG